MQNFELLKQWLAQEKRLECILPKGGVVCFPRFKNDVAVDTNKFYHTLLHKYKTMVGPGHWFEMPNIYMRIGFGGTNAATFEQGLKTSVLRLMNVYNKIFLNLLFQTAE